MQFPLEIGYGSVKINAHVIFETLAFMVAFRYFVFLRKRKSDPIPESNRLWIIVAATFGAFFFSRLLGALEVPSDWWQSENPLLYLFASKTIVGGLLGGLIFVEITKYYLHERSSSGDLFTFPLILGMIIGRIGCFTSGISEPTFGIETSLPWGMDLGDGLKRHPVALYEIIFLAFLWAVVYVLEKKYIFKNGYRFQFFMIAYLLFRLSLDFIKPGYHFIYGFGSIQIACLLGLVYYRKTVFYLVFRQKKLLLEVIE